MITLSPLLEPVRIGAWELPNRVVMSPLTRCRCGEGRVPTKLMAEYYTQRASVGLILTEACSVTPMGVGYPDTPGIWSSDQVEGWRLVTDSVHAAGGTILLQLWHVGRVSDPIYLDGELPVSPSQVPAPGHVSLVRPKKPYVIPRALEIEEIPGIVEAYRVGAENAMAAGFDGVEIHGANGYLIDQFLHTASNQRTDAYGGSLENRVRFLLEVTDEVVSVWGADRVGMHLSPRCESHEIAFEEREENFSFVAEKLRDRGLAFICAREAKQDDSLGPKIKSIFGGSYIVNEGFDPVSGSEAIKAGEADAVAFGKLVIANPDLVNRIAKDGSLNEWDDSKFFVGAEAGYTDYPVLS